MSISSALVGTSNGESADSVVTCDKHLLVHRVFAGVPQGAARGARLREAEQLERRRGQLVPLGGPSQHPYGVTLVANCAQRRAQFNSIQAIGTVLAPENISCKYSTMNSRKTLRCLSALRQ